ncbi:hypothetical protein GA0070214_103454 [Micromonospora chaiyaphumensis]|uniref:Uncharacterized protein n=2 Tax=Micromonospora chaiyaphumensis TaxID=307119 RepID=A0A1C4WD37_9ACTN|nr:hypothetical protein GA0070214_103454 [Micromonospora chaiyaphumensis]
MTAEASEGAAGGSRRQEGSKARAGRERDGALNRLVMVRTSAWRIPEVELLRRDPDCSPDGLTTEPGGVEFAAHRRLLEGLLRPEGVLDGAAWLGRVHHGEDAVDYKRADSEAGRSLMTELVDEVRQGCLAALDKNRQAWRQLAELRHQIFLEPQRLRSLRNPADPDLPLYAVVDISFSYLVERPLCRASISVWTSLPRSRRHVPEELLLPEVNGAQNVRIPADQIPAYRSYLLRVGESLQRLLAAQLLPVQFRVFDWQYDLPTFWVAVPGSLRGDAYRYLQRSERVGDRLARELLLSGTARDSVVSRAVLNGDFMVLRRFRREGETYTPHYLILPSRNGYPARDADGVRDPDRRAAAIRRQEENAAGIVIALSELEATSGSELYTVERDLEIWKNHLQVYTAMAERGAFLWDALSTHLPMRRGRALNEAHRAVQLLHQILLQGVADLGHLRALTRASSASIDAAAERLQDDFDTKLTELHGRSVLGLRGAITETGLFARVRQHGAEIVEQSSWVKSRYDDLLAAITSAFDERRVREADVIQKGGVVISLAVGLVSLVTVLDATTDMKTPRDVASTPGAPADANWLRWLHDQALGLLSRHANETALFSLACGVAVLGVALYVWVRFRSSGRLSSRQFRRLYDGSRGRLVMPNGHGVWHFLRDASTDSLEDFLGRARRQSATPEDARDNRQRWAELDDALAGRFADLWDRAAPMGVRRQDRVRSDIKALARRIEHWGIHGLLLTERPRQLHEYVLPRLICLYRFCIQWPDSFIEKVGRQNRPKSLVPDSEFVRAMQWLGFQRDQALEFDRHLHRWQKRQIGETRGAAESAGAVPARYARQLLDLLNELELSACCTAESVERLLVRSEAAAAGNRPAAPATPPQVWTQVVVQPDDLHPNGEPTDQALERYCVLALAKWLQVEGVRVEPLTSGRVTITGKDGATVEPVVLGPRASRLPRLTAGDNIEVSCAVNQTDLRGFPTRHLLRPVPAPLGLTSGHAHDSATALQGGAPDGMKGEGGQSDEPVTVDGIALLRDTATGRFTREPALWLRP